MLYQKPKDVINRGFLSNFYITRGTPPFIDICTFVLHKHLQFYRQRDRFLWIR